MEDQPNASNDPQTSRDSNKKREGVLSWDDYFMATAFLAGMRNEDTNTQVGACIVNEDKRIVGVGYNGIPNECSYDEFTWSKKAKKHKFDEKTMKDNDKKSLYVCHAEMNAIMNKNAADVKNCTIFVGLFPCNECAKIIIQSGITEVVYASDIYKQTPETIAAKRMFDKTGIKCREHVPTRGIIEIDFKKIDKDSQK